MKCKCGCGQEVSESKSAIKNRLKKLRKGKPTGYIKGHHMKEKRKDIVWFAGYAYLYMPNHPNAWKMKGYVKRSRLVMSEKLGRPLTDTEVVHHLNGEKSYDRPENLIITNQSTHMSEYTEHKRTLPDKICPTCRKRFYKGEHHYSAIFCSASCSNTGNYNGMSHNHIKPIAIWADPM